MIARESTLFLFASLFYGTLALGQTPPLPNSAADLFVPAVPGLTTSDFCRFAEGYPPDPNSSLPPCDFGTGPYGMFTDSFTFTAATDALGTFYLSPRNPIPVGTCTAAEIPVHQLEVHRVYSTGTAELLGYFQEQCSGSFVRSVSTGRNLHVDVVNGVLYIRIGIGYHTDAGQKGTQAVFLVRFEGIPSLFDIALTYEPPSTLSFNVPVRPEALPGADSFSVYTGDVESLPDLSQASALECAVPADRAPVAGEQLSVADTLTDPAAGDARYYLVAVNHQGETRAGREAVEGGVRGRNASVLPACP